MYPYTILSVCVLLCEFFLKQKIRQIIILFYDLLIYFCIVKIPLYYDTTIVFLWYIHHLKTEQKYFNQKYVSDNQH